jgi:hypothetical protein
MNNLRLLQMELRESSTVDVTTELLCNKTLGHMRKILLWRHCNIKGEVSDISFATEENVHYNGMTRVPSCQITKCRPDQSE